MRVTHPTTRFRRARTHRPAVRDRRAARDRRIRQLPRVLAFLGRRTAPRRWLAGGDAGMSTAEYAIGTVAACAFAALLYKVVTSTQILDLLTGVVSRALHVPF
jgi:hypothetical protein